MGHAGSSDRWVTATMSARRSSGSKVAARARAREQRILLDAERLARDQAREDAAEQFFKLSDARDALQERIVEKHAQMAVHVRRLLELGETHRRVAQFLDITLEEVKQFRATPPPSEEAGSASDRAEVG